MGVLFPFREKEEGREEERGRVGRERRRVGRKRDGEREWGGRDGESREERQYKILGGQVSFQLVTNVTYPLVYGLLDLLMWN